MKQNLLQEIEQQHSLHKILFKPLLLMLTFLSGFEFIKEVHSSHRLLFVFSTNLLVVLLSGHMLGKERK